MDNVAQHVAFFEGIGGNKQGVQANKMLLITQRMYTLPFFSR